MKIKTLLTQGSGNLELGIQLAKMLFKKNGIEIKNSIPTAKMLTPMDSKNFNAPFASPKRFQPKKSLNKQESSQDLDMTSPRDLIYNSNYKHPMLESDNPVHSDFVTNVNIEAFLNSSNLEHEDRLENQSPLEHFDLATQNEDRILSSKFREPPSTKKKELHSFSDSRSQSIMKTESCTKFQLDNSKGF